MNKRLLYILFALFVALQAKAQTEPLLLYKAEQNKKCLQWVDSVLHRMSLKEKVGQLFIYTIAPVRNKRNIALLKDAVHTYKVGGLLFSGGKLENQAMLTNQAQRMANVPLMITFDGEWGLSMRIHGMPVFPKNMVLGCIQDDRLIYEYGKEMARECRELGVQVNFAPVADVNINPKNPVINVRSFGENPIKVADKVVAYASGLESGKVLSVGKHFPGHGDTDVDSHKALPVLPFTRERLDSVELYPFKEMIQAGLSGIMVGHLQVPVFDPVGGLPSSLSRNIVYHLLIEEMGFKGLIFTDALSMKGVSSAEHVCLQALKAGNDMVLAPHDLKKEMDNVLQAVKTGEFSEEEIDKRCRKVLTYKYALGLNRRPYVRLSGLDRRINTPQTRDLVRRLNLAAITVLNNKRGILPLHPDLKEVAVLNVGKSDDIDVFVKQLGKYTSVARFNLGKEMSASAQTLLRDSLAKYKRIIVPVTEIRLAPYQSFFAGFAPKTPVIYVFFTPGKRMLQIHRAISVASVVVLGNSTNEDVQEQVADMLYGKASVDGRLSASIGGLFKTGAGVTITPATPYHFIPEEYGMRSEVLSRIDTIAMRGILAGAYPGCQVVVLKDGKTMYDKSFGTYTYTDEHKVTSTNMYDLASLSKTTGTLLAVMKLYDKGRFSLSDKISDYLPFLRRTNKAKITIRELLLHQSGLPSGLVFYQDAIDKKSYSGTLFKSKQDAFHSVQIGPKTFAQPGFRFKEGLTSPIGTGDYTLHVADSLWLHKSFKEVMLKKIADAPLKGKKYVYSCLNFILLQQLVEQLTGMPMDEYLAHEFYEPMGLEHTAYLPLRYFRKENIVPSTVDRFLRKSTLQGFVHDESAAFLGGISGNAGLFSTAADVARVYQMILNGGELDGQRYLSKETCHLFTTETSKISRRGLGFDKPAAKDASYSPCCLSAPPSVYGHTGFTGTCAWTDPDNGLVYVFLSNRTYPDAWVNKLSKLEIREQIQETLYEALAK
ncbi:glycoside hydrolase family 3 N-terminal domain-containing protein [uncultured Bacteroides sp.]|uniref:glycoside hydrolase family 3 N-terminal domain-containing protein n=1 Tax=uncultured Bacteroides sp. TaxID=162156 RepID=UPI002AA80871|nr:glycoside hydrolase family 3 N-terminal domain-containing protein [uncultured Bacteroides sp.]